jgi:hypothetical protein
MLLTTPPPNLRGPHAPPSPDCEIPPTPDVPPDPVQMPPTQVGSCGKHWALETQAKLMQRLPMNSIGSQSPRLPQSALLVQLCAKPADALRRKTSALKPSDSTICAIHALLVACVTCVPRRCCTVLI